MMKNEDILSLMDEQLDKDPKAIKFKTSPYGQRRNTAAEIVTTGRKHTRSYGEAPYLS